MVNERIGDPGVVAISWFGIALVMLGLVEVVTGKAAGGLGYAVLIAGIAEAVGGAIAIGRGDTYLGSIIGVFGLWLIGFHLLSSDPAAATSDSLGLYTLVVIGPLTYLLIPAVALRAWILTVALGLIMALFAVLGISYLDGSSTLAKLAGWLSFASAAPVWYLGGERLLENLHLIGTPAAAVETSTDAQRASALAGEVHPS
jgi:succinate-acetate transporter protein